MNLQRAAIILLVALVFPSTLVAQLQYPKTRQQDTVDDYHGTKVADPYRWLEDVESKETAAWVEQQNKLTSEYLEAIPGRDAIRNADV